MFAKSAIWLVAAFAALATVVPSSAATDGPARAQRVYLALGDSLAYGTVAGAPANEPYGYVPRLLPFFSLPFNGDVDKLENLAKGGETSASFIDNGQLDQALVVINDPRSDVRIVTLDIGGNDLLNLLWEGQPCYPPAVSDPRLAPCGTAVAAAVSSFPARYAVILSKLESALRKNPGHERTFVMTYYNPFSVPDAVVNSFPEPEAQKWRGFEAAVATALVGSDGGLSPCPSQSSGLVGDAKMGMNDAINCIGRGYGATVVDVYPTFQEHGLDYTGIGSFDPHPNALGYDKIAGVFKDAAARVPARD